MSTWISESHGSEKVGKKVEYTHCFRNNFYLLGLKNQKISFSYYFLNLFHSVYCLVVHYIGYHDLPERTETDRNGPKRTFVDTETDFLGTETDFSGYRNGPRRTGTDRNGPKRTFFGYRNGLSGYRNGL